MTGFLNLTEVASKRKTMIPVFWNHGLNLMMLINKRPFFCGCFFHSWNEAKNNTYPFFMNMSENILKKNRKFAINGLEK